MIYFLNCFPKLSRKTDLCQMWLISFLFLSLSSAVFAFPYGIQYNSVHNKDLDNRGCTLCYERIYHSPTTSDDILSCTGPVLFVGGRKYEWWDPIIYLGAFGLAEEVHKSTDLNIPHESNGVYWYLHSGKSFGFLADMDLHQEPAADTGTSNPDSRLSWNLDNHYGGWRAGKYDNLAGQSYFNKVIWNCPNN